MKLRPINGRIVVRAGKSKEKSSGGIYLPDTARGKVQEGKVIAVAKDASGEVAVGDRIIYKEFSGTEVRIDGEDYLLLTADDLLAKYEEVDEIPE